MSVQADPVFALTSCGAQGNTLSEIYDGLVEGDLVETLDPLNVLLPLLTSKDEAAWKILQIIADKCNAREIILAAAESLENLHRSSLNESDIEEEGEELALPDQTLRLMNLYCAVVPRVPIRKKGPASIVQGFVAELSSVVSNLSDGISGEDGRRILASGHELSTSISCWAKAKEGISIEEIKSLHDILCNFIESLVDSLAHCINASLAMRSFIEVFPRLGSLHASENDDRWKEGTVIISNMNASYIEMRGGDYRTRPPQISKASFILFAYWQFATRDQPMSNPPSYLSHFLPVLLSSIQTNTIIDETLSFLLLSLRQASHLSPEIIIPLSTMLPPFCSAHPDPSIRHYAFRAFSLLLDRTEPPLRMQILQDLTSDKEAPQMRVAAVGLVKDSLIAALGSTSNVLASPMFLKTFGNILFTPDPPSFFSEPKTKMTEEEQNELVRLTECLGLLYVLMVRDVGNKTGIRDKDNLANVERTLLKPMSDAIPTWIEQAAAADDGHPDSIIPLMSIQLNLERVYEVLDRLKGPL
ncbi:hypothetical protein AAF712_004323 [Marasmius tenuissimus]|uniref:ARM repeat superfamily protein n=1 Tax=Marasmius tenuissimus TaxID=585030 RepID=A0ABR3A7T4_9AGAR